MGQARASGANVHCPLPAMLCYGNREREQGQEQVGVWKMSHAPLIVCGAAWTTPQGRQ